MKCGVCFHHCDLLPGQVGLCKGRINKDGLIVAKNYGCITSLALDPIEKKPLRLFHPGSLILSLGSYGCNLRCPFCQNYEISQFDLSLGSSFLGPEEAVAMALRLVKEGNIGLAYTYNEPLISYEYVRDCAKFAHEKGLLNVLVSNGTCSIKTLDEILPYIDAMNIDLKGFTDEFYHYLGGDLLMSKEFIVHAYRKTHMELTTLIIPGKNDAPAEMEAEAKWIASLDKNIALHIDRYFPRYKETEKETSLESLQTLAKIARKYLKHVYVGNV